MQFNWGIVGYGWVARDFFVPGLAAAGHRLLAVVDPDGGARQRATEDGAAAFAQLDQLIALRPDAVYVATPNHLHRSAVEALAAAAIPVLCEKPMAASLTDAEAIARAVAGGRYGTAFDQRHHPAHRAIAEAVRAGAIGRVTAVRIVYACWVDPSWSPTGAANWRADAAAAGGGAVIDLALHGLDLAQLLVGAPLDRLQMMLQRRVHDYAVDDGGMLLGRFADGTLLQQHVAYNCPEELPRRRLELVGERGMIVATNTMGQTAGGTVELVDGATGASSPLRFDTATSPFAAQATAFAEYVTRGGEGFSVERDIALMRLFDAAHREAQPCR